MLRLANAVVLNLMLGATAALSFLLLCWQWLVARRFPLHRPLHSHGGESEAAGLTLLKPLKGCDSETEACLRSWFQQQYRGPVQVLFAVVSTNDPVVSIVNRLRAEFASVDCGLVVCPSIRATNAKVAKLAELLPHAKHSLLVISDADVRVPSGLLTEIASAFEDERTGLVTFFYQLKGPVTLAMRWEALAVNADFWSQVLQSASIKPIDFALGAVMGVSKAGLEKIGGFVALQDCLADDYQLGNRIAHQGKQIVLARTVVECWSHAMGWGAVWNHQLRWARTIRVCQPVPYFFSILSNPTLWPLIWAAFAPSALSAAAAGGCVLFRLAITYDLYSRLCQTRLQGRYLWLVPLKDLLQAGLWIMAFLGNTVEWRGEKMRLRRDGMLVRDDGTQLTDT